jgi:predicted glycogen debranching enzyme
MKTLAERKRLEDSLLAVWENTNKLASPTPGWIEQLVLTANQFLVRRELPGDPEARSIIAGYRWFGDWGRDTMIALPGLLITTGHFDTARTVLLAFSRYVDRGNAAQQFPGCRRDT